MQCKETRKCHGTGQQGQATCVGCDPVLAGVARGEAGGVNPELQFANARDAMLRIINGSSTLSFDEKQMLRANLCEMAAAFDALTGADQQFNEDVVLASGDGFRVGGSAR